MAEVEAERAYKEQMRKLEKAERCALTPLWSPAEGTATVQSADTGQGTHRRNREQWTNGLDKLPIVSG